MLSYEGRRDLHLDAHGHEFGVCTWVDDIYAYVCEVWQQSCASKEQGQGCTSEVRGNRDRDVPGRWRDQVHGNRDGDVPGRWRDHAMYPDDGVTELVYTGTAEGNQFDVAEVVIIAKSVAMKRPHRRQWRKESPK